MKLLFAANLKGHPRHYASLLERADHYSAMFWLGDLLDPNRPDLEQQRAVAINAAGEIQSRGCRVLASGPQADSLELWHWLRGSGTFIAPGYIVTRHTHDDSLEDRQIELREAAWNAGALWIVLADSPDLTWELTGGTPADRDQEDYTSHRFAPDLIFTCREGGTIRSHSPWYERRGQTWVLTPDAGVRSSGAEIVLDPRRHRVTRKVGKRIDSRDISALFESRVPSDRDLAVHAI